MYYIGSVQCFPSDIRHHGILGMRWGKRNGPPYPLSPGAHSKSEQKAGWRKSLDGGSKAEDNKRKQGGFRLTDGQKRALKIGAAAAVTGLAVYGAYRMGAFDGLAGKVRKHSASRGKNEFSKLLDDSGRVSLDSLKEQVAANQKKLDKIHTKDIETSRFGGALSRTINFAEEQARSVNPSGDGRNCVACSAVMELLARGKKGLVAKAKPHGELFRPQDLDLLFNDVQFEQVKPGQDTREAYSNLVEKIRSFGSGARGAIFAKFRPEVVAMLEKRGLKGLEEHAFSFEVFGQTVALLDGQSGVHYKMPLQDLAPFSPELFWVARLDNLKLDEDCIPLFADVLKK